MDNLSHEIIIRGENGLQVRCACGVFIIDREDDPEISLVEITRHVVAHYAQAAHPELLNGGRPKLIKGRKGGSGALG